MSDAAATRTVLPPLLVAARRGRDGWRVWVSSAIGQALPELAPAEARQLAAELVTYADLCDAAIANIDRSIDTDTVELIA